MSLIFYDDIFGLRKSAYSLLEENGLDVSLLPKNAYVFFMHQGYQFLYFITENGVDDPFVYYFTEGGEKKIIKSEMRLSEWLEALIWPSKV